MSLFRNITMYLLAIIFLVSSSGYVLYTSKCACSGTESTSVFIRPETCETSFHQHHRHDTAGSETKCSGDECHECHAHNDGCGCEDPIIYFFKLEDKATNEAAKYLLADAPVIDIKVTVIHEESLSDGCASFAAASYNDPPPKIGSGLDFLISIRQLKIPSLV